MADTETSGDADARFRASYADGQAWVAGFECRHFFLQCIENIGRLRDHVKLGNVVLGFPLPELDPRPGALEGGFIGIARALGSFPVPKDIELDVNSSQRVTHGIVAEVVQLSVLYGFRQVCGELRLAGDALKVGA